MKTIVHTLQNLLDFQKLISDILYIIISAIIILAGMMVIQLIKRWYGNAKMRQIHTDNKKKTDYIKVYRKRVSGLPRIFLSGFGVLVPVEIIKACIIGIVLGVVLLKFPTSIMNIPLFQYLCLLCYYGDVALFIFGGGFWSIRQLIKYARFFPILIYLSGMFFIVKHLVL